MTWRIRIMRPPSLEGAVHTASTETHSRIPFYARDAEERGGGTEKCRRSCITHATLAIQTQPRRVSSGAG